MIYFAKDVKEMISAMGSFLELCPFVVLSYSLVIYYNFPFLMVQTDICIQAKATHLKKHSYNKMIRIMKVIIN